MEVKENNWKGFYEDRVNSTYQDYFEERYKVMLDTIKSLNHCVVREEGIGIGSIHKALAKEDIFSYGFDNDLHMLGLCQRNNPKAWVYRDNILKPTWTENDGTDLYADLVVTHGVLEHFSDKEILRINARYRAKRQKRIHYVPLEGYGTPSFGDERLLPANYWLDLLNPKDHIIFNDGLDLLLIN